MVQPVDMTNCPHHLLLIHGMMNKADSNQFNNDGVSEKVWQKCVKAVISSWCEKYQ